MGKISPVNAKYIVHVKISIEGIVDKPDVIGAIFGQTEGLLGSELELRELQRSGRIGRIEVKLENKNGRTSGEIIIPSSLDKAETAIIGAALETTQRIGPCNSKVLVETIEDIRITKRDFVIERAKELLKELTNKVLPDSQEITEQVTQSVRMMELVEYGRERLAAGPSIEDSEEVILVEGRADVLNLLKHGIKNVIALNGTSIPETIRELGSKKVLTLFIDGDRGGDLIVRGLINAGIEIDYIARAPDGKEVEEITKKEIHKAIRSKITTEQVKLDLGIIQHIQQIKEKIPELEIQSNNLQERRVIKPELRKFKDLLDDLVGTRGAYILDESMGLLGKVPIAEIPNTIKNLSSAYAVVFDGYIDRNIVDAAENSGVKYLAAMKSRVNPRETKIELITSNDF
ncbi:MAG: DNA primase DnaG [Nanoarchaeota archaeon]